MPVSKKLNPKLPSLEFEKKLWEEGYPCVCGLDEAGRGAWAGPVCAAAVILPNDERVKDLLSGVRDSKKMTARQRERWRDCIKSTSIAWAAAFATHSEIDEIGIVPATRLAMQRAIDELKIKPTFLLIDYLKLPEINLPQKSMPKGDALSLSIAAASVLAKTARDALMINYEKTYPGYGLVRNKGYGTREHRGGVEKLGCKKIHRMSFKPMKFMMK